MKKRKAAVQEILNDLNIYTDLNNLIVDYDTVQWEGKQVQEIKFGVYPWKIISDQKYLYLCVLPNHVARYTLDTLQLVDTFPIHQPYAIDISGNELYVHESQGPIKVFDILTKEIIRQWKITGDSTAIKLCDEKLYCANYRDHRIDVYTLSGELIKHFGKAGQGPGEFQTPLGMDIYDQFIYIADYSNSRVQVFHLLSCTYSCQWGSFGTENGQFTSPHEVRLFEDFCYVGDQSGVQMFTKAGEFLHRFGKSLPGRGIGEFHFVRGILVIGNNLYVSDHSNKRLVVLQ